MGLRILVYIVPLACQVKSVYSACSDITDVPDCFCPQNETVKKPDPYDDTKYLLCADGERYIFECSDGEIFYNETQSCGISTTPFPSGCPGDINIKMYLNCTCFRYCFNDGKYADSCCPSGEIFDESTEQCEVFEFFSCTDREDGRYADNHNCSIYHTCVEGDLFTTDYCQEGLVFNETTGLCEEGDCDEIPDCGVCPDDQTFIKIDCLNFYDCRENTESSDPEFVPVPEKCPEDSCFNEETGSCEENSQNIYFFLMTKKLKNNTYQENYLEELINLRQMILASQILKILDSFSFCSQSSRELKQSKTNNTCTVYNPQF
ncbi:hypothetical protein Anas_05611 [Armadillidium nasatum]|uniref:Chitin-binding type-2 domain-containing protein n=1 Tax=Armadillidium nasatum TaxID=96803 RepID=A0A5N5SK52_9CRUS|nr:hypothetical protein Anas_05611 [Armadillidium nasatum]